MDQRRGFIWLRHKPLTNAKYRADPGNVYTLLLLGWPIGSHLVGKYEQNDTGTTSISQAVDALIEHPYEPQSVLVESEQNDTESEMGQEVDTSSDSSYEFEGVLSESDQNDTNSEMSGEVKPHLYDLWKSGSDSPPSRPPVSPIVESVMEDISLEDRGNNFCNRVPILKSNRRSVLRNENCK